MKAPDGPGIHSLDRSKSRPEREREVQVDYPTHQHLVPDSGRCLGPKELVSLVVKQPRPSKRC